MTFAEFLSVAYIPILKNFEGHLEKHKEYDNYRLLIALENKIMSLEGLRPLQLTDTLDMKAKLLQDNPAYIYNFIRFPLASICAQSGSEQSHDDAPTAFTNSYYAELMLNTKVR